MYFKDRKDTNIDEEFEDSNLLSRIIRFINNHKVILVVGLVVFIILVFGIILFFNGNRFNVTNYLTLNGEDNITIYKGSDYIEPGYIAYNSKNDDLSSEVKIVSTLNNDKVGEYEITYSIYDIVKKRKVTVVEKPKEYVYIYLTPVENSVDIYLKKGEEYVEPGYQVFSSAGKTLTSDVKIIGSVDTSKVGNYKLVYSVVDTSGITISATRTVIVMDSDIKLSLSSNKYTNGDVNINILVIDNYFDYIVLPNDNKITDSSYSYKVSSNGVYNFKVYNKKGFVKEASIEVKNIDREAPNGSCTIDYNSKGSTITVNATDVSGIKKYIYNGKDYNSNVITLSSYIDDAKVTVYDNAGNSSVVGCKSTALSTITSISKNGVIVTVKATSVGGKISGYYFSYDGQRPDKETGGYVATSDTTIDVVRLQGTTYVWVEDSNGNISSPKTIEVSSSDIPITGSSRLKVVNTSNYPLNATQVKNFDNLIYRSSRAAGLYSKEAAATSALAVLYVSSQEYGFTYGYKYGKQSYALGNKILAYTGDCDGFVNWAYVNAGYNFQKYHPNVSNNYYLRAPGYSFDSDNGEPGDVLRKKGHTAIIVGKNKDGFLIAEAYSTAKGHLINLYKYNLADHYVIKGEWLEENYAYSRYPRNDYPSGY